MSELAIWSWTSIPSLRRDSGAQCHQGWMSIITSISIWINKSLSNKTFWPSIYCALLRESSVHMEAVAVWILIFQALLYVPTVSNQEKTLRARLSNGDFLEKKEIIVSAKSMQDNCQWKKFPWKEVQKLYFLKVGLLIRIHTIII